MTDRMGMNWHFDRDDLIPAVVERLCPRCLRKYEADPHMAMADLCDKCFYEMEEWLYE